MRNLCKTTSLSLSRTLIVILLISFFVSNEIASQNDFQLYRSREKHFSIYFPNGWSIEKGRNPHVVVKSRSIDKIASMFITHLNNVGYKPITNSISPEDLVKKYIDSGWDIKIIDSGQTTFWNEKALYIKFLATLNHMGQTVKMVMWQIAFNHLNEGYSIGFTAGGTNDETVNKKYKYYEQYFRKSLASFSLDDWGR